MKSKLSKIVIIAMFIMMSLMASGKSFAVELTEKKIGYNDIADGTPLSLNNLEDDNHWYLLCDEHGGPLPNDGDIQDPLPSVGETGEQVREWRNY